MTDLGAVAEKATPDYTATLRDTSTGNPITLTQLLTLTLTLYNVGTGTVIRSAQSAKNANDVTFHSTSGLLTWAVQQADTTIEVAGAKRERRRAVFAFTWDRDGVSKRDAHTIEFTVLNEPKVS